MRFASPTESAPRSEAKFGSSYRSVGRARCRGSLGASNAVESMSDLAWYRAIAPFSSFSALTAHGHFHRVPNDWTVVATDIAGSTDAIERGHYKDVNTLGAASIVAVRNALSGAEFPFSFGGDGATIAIPSALAPRALTALDRLGHLARANFSLALRVGSVTTAELASLGCDLEVGKFTINGQRSLAVFRGGALAKAEEILKSRRFAEPADPHDAATDDPSALNGLSCRWQAVPSTRGRMVTLMVTATGRPDDAMPTYARIISRLEAIIGGDLFNATPIHHENMTYRPLLEMLRDEWRYSRKRLSLSFVRRMLEIVAAWLVFRCHIPPLFFDHRHYARALCAHSDFRKFDDMLRLVLDVTLAQRDAIRSMLEELHAAGEIRFGLHESDNALMTCYVDTLEDGGHIHFVDGGDGGYALAARSMKSQAAPPSRRPGQPSLATS
ncbi:MAG: DUF3095 domain-containing protein [Phycisphaerales bacterium]|nr:DUF3095 domain-containing protein [Phycisphaerales bacterium]